MTSARAHRDPLCRFYTESAIGDILVASMGRHPPRRVLDLASGGGALGAAASRLWKSSILVSVDIDADVDTSPVDGRRRHLVADALDVDLPDMLGRDGTTFDATLCNPPYIVPRWRPGFDRILEEAGLSGARGVAAGAGAEVLFAAQNLRLVAEDGRVGLIVPDGVITGSRTRVFREGLIAAHRVDGVVELPRRAFRRTEAKAFVLVLRKGGGPAKRVRLGRVEEDGSMSRPIWVPTSSAGGRLDYGHHAEMASGGSLTLASIGVEITRGVIEPNASAPWGLPTFHTRDFPKGDARAAYSLPGAPGVAFPPGTPIAEAGDLLIARVDRSLERKVCMVTAGRAAFSSSVYRLRMPEVWRTSVARSLLSPAGERRLAATARGVAARMISKADLLDMILPP